jgi:hypothetical protein
MPAGRRGGRTATLTIFCVAGPEADWRLIWLRATGSRGLIVGESGWRGRSVCSVGCRRSVRCIDFYSEWVLAVKYVVTYANDSCVK